MQRLDSVHLGHHVIEENNVVMLVLDHVDRIRSRIRYVGNDTVQAHEVPCDLEVHLVVVNDQDVSTLCIKACLVLAGSCA